MDYVRGSPAGLKQMLTHPQQFSRALLGRAPAAPTAGYAVNKQGTTKEEELKRLRALQRGALGSAPDPRVTIGTAARSATAAKRVGDGKPRRVGSKKEVYHGHAHRTGGGLQRHHLTVNKRGKVVSIKKLMAGKKAFKNLTG